MKFLLDNNLPPALASALHSLTIAQYEEHTVTHLAKKFDRDTSDSDWIDTLAKEGDWSVISQDRFRKGNVEREAVRRSGIVVFCLDKSWSKHKFWDKAQNLIRWWPPIIQQSSLVAGGAAFKVPWRFSGTGRFEQIRL